MQAARLIILSLLFVILLPVISQAESNQENWSEKKAYPCLERNTSTYTSILSILLTREGELASDCSHNTYDKKSYLRLFLHPKYDKAYPPADITNVKAWFTPLPTGPDAISYYVYTLRKIIV